MNYYPYQINHKKIEKLGTSDIDIDTLWDNVIELVIEPSEDHKEM